MFTFKNDKFYISRGDSGNIDIINQERQFTSGEVIEFKVYEENGLDAPPVLVKEKVVDSATNTVTIQLLSDDTNFAEPENNYLVYWYEIKLNGEVTLLGFDESGAKILYLYPTGIDNVNS